MSGYCSKSILDHLLLFSSSLEMILRNEIRFSTSDCVVTLTFAQMKYSKHPQKFNNPDPQLQKQWEDLKDVLCDNEYMMGYKIMIGRPINLKTIWEILSTVNTDTPNIWSHIFFGFFFVWQAIGESKRLVFVNLLCALTYFMSAVYHTFRNYSRRLYDILLSLDVSSINIQIFSLMFSDIFAMFYDAEPELTKKIAIIYAIVFIVSTGAVPIILAKKLYWVRTCMFCMMCTITIPVVYWKLSITGFDDQMKKFLVLRSATFGTQIIGLCFRSGHIPERWFPRTIWQTVFHSHFWFHTIAGVGSMFGVLSAKVY